MRRALMAAIAASLLLAACSGGEPNQTVATPTAGEATPAVEGSPEGQDAVDDAGLGAIDPTELPPRDEQTVDERRAAEDHYLGTLRQMEDPDLSYLSDSQVIEVGVASCDYMDDNPDLTYRLGHTFIYTFEVPDEVDEVRDSLALFYGAMVTVCPEHSEDFLAEAEEWD